MINNFLKTSLAYTIANFGAKGINLLLTFLVIRFLEPNLFAEIDLLLSYVLYGALIISFSIETAVSRFIHDSNLLKAKYISNGFVFIHVVFALFAIIIYYTFNPFQGNSIISKYFLPFLILVYTYTLSNYISSLLRNLFRVKQFFYFLLIPSILNLLIVVFLFYLDNFNFNFYLYSIIFSSLVGIIFGLFYLRGEFILSVNLKILAILLSYSLPIFFSAILLQFIPVFQKTYIETISISLLAIYAFGTKFMIIFQTLNQSIYSIIVPYSFKNFNNAKFKINFDSVFNISLLAFSTLLFFLVISLGFFIDFFFNDIYQESVRYILILSIPVFLDACYLFVSISFAIDKKPKYYLYNDIIYFVSFLLGIYFFANNSLISIILPAVFASIFRLFSSILFQIKQKTFLLKKTIMASIILFIFYASTSFYFYNQVNHVVIKIYAALFYFVYLLINRGYLLKMKNYIIDNNSFKVNDKKNNN